MQSDTLHRQLCDFFRGCGRAVRVCAEQPAVRDMAERFERQLGGFRTKDFAPRPIAALRHLEQVGDMRLARDFQAFARRLPWRDSPLSADRGARIGVFELNDAFDMGAVTAGLLYVDAGARCRQPDHAAQDLRFAVYFLISGTARWRYGGSREYQSTPAGNVLCGPPRDMRGMIAGHTPSLSLYLQTAQL